MGARAGSVTPSQLGHVKRGKQDFIPVPAAALEILGLERILWRVWCEALSIPVPLSEEDELPLQEQYLERELVPSWLQEQSCLPSPGRTGVHCSRVIWGLCVRG